jgi:hypothetical protein
VRTTSPDGYIRLPFADFMTLPFMHLFSENDAVFLVELQAQTVPARLAGFSEWKSRSTPTISLGWGWFVHAQSDQILLAPDRVRSNLMLRDARGYDLGSLKTSELLSTWLSAFDWKDTVRKATCNADTCQY